MAAHFALMTDSTSDLPESLAAERQIYIAPLHILWGQDNLKDRVDITIEQFHARLTTSPDLPTTSQPSPAEFVELYRQARDETGADGVLVMTISADLSGTYSSAQQAAPMVDFPVRVVDLRTVSVATGLAVLKVAEARDDGATLDEATRLAESLQTRTRLIFTLDTLEYLHRGGRIGGARRLLGTALNIKPILHVEDGKIEARESVRTRKRAISRLVEVCQEEIDPARPLYVAALHSRALAEMEALEAAIAEQYHPDLLIKAEIGATISVHAGPGAVGVALLQ
jgi:DegV family protein with EDD domain